MLTHQAVPVRDRALMVYDTNTGGKNSCFSLVTSELVCEAFSRLGDLHSSPASQKLPTNLGDIIPSKMPLKMNDRRLKAAVSLHSSKPVF